MIAPAHDRYIQALGRAATGTTRRRTDPTPYLLLAIAAAVPAACAAPGWAPVTTPLAFLACWAWWRTKQGANQ